MKYLLDTDVIVNHLRSRDPLSDNISPDESAISVVTYGELIYGAHKSQRKRQVFDQIQSFLDTYSLPLLEIDVEVVIIFSQIKAALELQGERLDDMDLLISATALHHSLILVTKNVKHFSRIPQLQIYSS